jgi:hypothetical protein
MSDLPAFKVRSDPDGSLHAAVHKILPLRADNLLIDRLFEAVKVSLRHAELHLIFSLLSLGSL